MIGKPYLVKLPLSFTAPPTDLSLGKPSIFCSAVLLAMRKPPPTVSSEGSVMLVSLGLLTNETSPEVVEVKLGARNVWKKLESKRMEPLTTRRAGASNVDTLEMVMLAIQTRVGKLTWRFRPLALMLRLSVRFPSRDSYLTRRRLLLMSIEATDTMLRPSRLLRNVSLTTTSRAVRMPDVKVRESKAVSETKLTLPTVVRAGKLSVDRAVRFCRWNSPEMLLRPEAENEVTPPLLTSVRSPSMAWMPWPRLRIESVRVPMVTLPLSVLQVPRLVISACELMLISAWVHGLPCAVREMALRESSCGGEEPRVTPCD